MQFTVEKPRILPENIYVGKFIDTEMTEGKFGRQILWHFVVTTKRGETKLRVYSDPTINDKTRGYRILCALAGRTLAVGEGLDSDHYKGHECRLLVKKQAGRDGAEYNKVEDVLPLAKLDDSDDDDDEDDPQKPF